MNLSAIDGLIYLVISLLLFLLVQRWLHGELQAILLLLTRRPSLTIGLFSLIFFPGVLLHEVSHYLAAVILRVKTGRFSVIPRVLADGKIRMGYVETAVTDPLRDTLIGTAPLVTGLAVMAALGASKLGLVPLAGLVFQGQWSAFFGGLQAVTHLQDFWLWFYLAFTVSSTMLPSASDRRAWLPVILTIVVLLVIALLAGAGTWMMAHIAAPVNSGLRILAVVFGVSLMIHLALALPAWLLRLVISRITGMRVIARG